jgi:prepilin-type processing-associated H-X9-DG protein
MRSGLSNVPPCFGPNYTFPCSYFANAQFCKSTAKPFLTGKNISNVCILLDGENAGVRCFISYSDGHRWIADNIRSFRHNKGINVLFGDLHVAWQKTAPIPESDWHKKDFWWCDGMAP